MSLIARLSGIQETLVSSRREFLSSICRDVLGATGLLYLFGLSQALASEPKNELKTDSIQALRELDELITEFDDYYLDNSEYGKALKTLFSQIPETTKRKFEGYSKIKIENGEILVPKSQTELDGAEFEEFNDTITINGISPRLKLEYLLEGIPFVQLARLHEIIHFFQDDNSDYDEFFDMEKRHRIMGGYLKELDIAVFIPSNHRVVDVNQVFTRYTGSKLGYSQKIPRDHLRLFFNDLTHTEPWRSHYLNGGLNGVEQNIYDFLKKFQENEVNGSIIFEAQAYFVASPESISKAKVRTNDIAEYITTYITLENHYHKQVRNAVDSISRAYASLLNSNVLDMEKHKIVAGIVGRNQFTYNPESGRYDGVEKEVTELEKKYGKGSVAKLDDEREKQFKEIVNETSRLFHRFLAMKGYTHISILKTEIYED